MTDAIQSLLPPYQSHKIVHAARILAIGAKSGEHINLQVEIPIRSGAVRKGITLIEVESAWVEKHKPEVGGYLVAYADGYQSYSPAQAFEEGYTLIELIGQPSPGATAADDDTIEQQIQAAGKTAPRVTPDAIKTNIICEYYFTAADGVDGSFNTPLGCGVDFPERDTLRLLTFCVLVLRNGFTVTGESACASPENFDAQIGRDIARKNAVEKMWPLMGYQLREQLYQMTQPAQIPE